MKVANQTLLYGTQSGVKSLLVESAVSKHSVDPKWPPVTVTEYVCVVHVSEPATTPALSPLLLLLPGWLPEQDLAKEGPTTPLLIEVWYSKKKGKGKPIIVGTVATTREALQDSVGNIHAHTGWLGSIGSCLVNLANPHPLAMQAAGCLL